jgi:hypothetical protein
MKKAPVVGALRTKLNRGSGSPSRGGGGRCKGGLEAHMGVS